MIQEEGKRIFREQNCEKYPIEAYIAVHGDEDIEYLLKLSDKWLQNFLERYNFSFWMLRTKLNKNSVTPEMLKMIEKYHLALLMKQLSVMNDSVLGLLRHHMSSLMIRFLLNLLQTQRT